MAVGRDGTVELKAYQGLARVEFTGLDSLVDSSNAVNFPHLAAPEAAGKLAAVTVQSQEKLLLTSSGKIVYEGPFSATDIDEETSWVEWNKARDAELHRTEFSIAEYLLCLALGFDFFFRLHGPGYFLDLESFYPVPLFFDHGDS
jgi:hypothetical protein